jgi:hypothetical protein
MIEGLQAFATQVRVLAAITDIPCIPSYSTPVSNATKEMTMRAVIGVLLVMFGAASVSAQVAPPVTPPVNRRPPTAEELAKHEESMRLRAQRQALRDLDAGTITLEQAAARSGGHVTLDATPNPDTFEARDLASLAKQSRLVVIGRPFGVAQSQLSDDQRNVVTRYTVQVDEVVTSHGPQLAKLVTVEVPGGRVDFAGGNYAEALHGPELKIGERYVLYLRGTCDAMGEAPRASTLAAGVAGDTARAPQVFAPAGFQREGIFQVTSDNVVSLAPAEHSLKRQYDKRPVEAFLAEVRAAR